MLGERAREWSSLSKSTYLIYPTPQAKQASQRRRRPARQTAPHSMNQFFWRNRFVNTHHNTIVRLLGSVVASFSLSPHQELPLPDFCWCVLRRWWWCATSRSRSRRNPLAEKIISRGSSTWSWSVGWLMPPSISKVVVVVVVAVRFKLRFKWK